MNNPSVSVSPCPSWVFNRRSVQSLRQPFGLPPPFTQGRLNSPHFTTRPGDSITTEAAKKLLPPSRVAQKPHQTQPLPLHDMFGRQPSTKAAKWQLLPSIEAAKPHQTQPLPPRDAFGLQRKHRSRQAAPRTCDGSERRQIPVLFFPAGKRACAVAANKQESSQITTLSSVIMPAAGKKGD